MTDKEKLCCNAPFLNLIQDKKNNQMRGTVSLPIRVILVEANKRLDGVITPNEVVLKTIILSTTGGVWDSTKIYSYILHGADPLVAPTYGYLAYTPDEQAFNDSIVALYDTNLAGYYTQLTIVVIDK